MELRAPLRFGLEFVAWIQGSGFGARLGNHVVGWGPHVQFTEISGVLPGVRLKQSSLIKVLCGALL